MKKASKKAAAKTTKATKAVKATSTSVISIKKGATTEGRRGLMGDMVGALVKAGKGLNRDELAKRFAKGKVTRVQVMKNVQWGVRNGVFAEKAA